MPRPALRLTVAGPVLELALLACSPGSRAPLDTAPPPAAGSPAALTPAALAAADSGRPPYTTADVHFLSGMIPHHAQAVLIAGWAPSHGASASVQALCARIVVAQQDEIAFMQRWLRARHEPVPDGDAAHDMMPGLQHGTLMPGMLTPGELMELNSARGPEFDRLFLTFMIRHHQGAITMVEQLFAAYGAAQDDDVFKFAADVNADQSSEIERMSIMLEALSPGNDVHEHQPTLPPL